MDVGVEGAVLTETNGTQLWAVPTLPEGRVNVRAALERQNTILGVGNVKVAQGQSTFFFFSQQLPTGRADNNNKICSATKPG